MNPLQSIAEHPEQRKHESREKMGRNDKKTEPMNPTKNNRANLEIEAKKGEKHTSTNRGREPTQGNDRNQAINHHPCPIERPQQTDLRSLSGREHEPSRHKFNKEKERNQKCPERRNKRSRLIKGKVVRTLPQSTVNILLVHSALNRKYSSPFIC